jgi:hypothetical protein
MGLKGAQSYSKQLKASHRYVENSFDKNWLISTVRKIMPSKF